MQFEFKAIDIDGVESTRKFSADSWITALSEFHTFLKGAGFSLRQDSIGVSDMHSMAVGDLHNVVVFSQEEILDI